MATARVHDAQLQAFIHDPNGGIYRDLRKRGRRVKRLAKVHVGKDTGRLAEAIDLHNVLGLKFPTVAVRADHRKALMHHNGTRPHVITPNSGRMLKFKIAGKIVYAERVNHPGTRPNPFLTRALREGAH